MASSRIYRTTKLSDGSTYRESYSVPEYVFYKIFTFIIELLKLTIFTLPYYLFVKIPFLVIVKTLSIIPQTKDFSKKIGDESYSINQFKKRTMIYLSAIVVIMFIMVNRDINKRVSTPTNINKVDTIKLNSTNRKQKHKKSKHNK